MTTIITSVISGLFVAVPTMWKLHIDNKKNNIDEKLNEVKNEIMLEVNHIHSKIKEMDKNQCKNYLSKFLTHMEQNKTMGSSEIEHAYYIYDHYVNDLKGNSYIQAWWDRVMNKRG